MTDQLTWEANLAGRLALTTVPAWAKSLNLQKASARALASAALPGKASSHTWLSYSTLHSEHGRKEKKKKLESRAGDRQ